MSTYYNLWKVYESQQQAAATLLASVGLAMVLGWLLLDKWHFLPSKWQAAAQWAYLWLLLGLNGLVLIGLG